jgi:uncharacterized repeat protein (TIGR01451 family)
MKTHRLLIALIVLLLAFSMLALLPAAANGTPVVSPGYDPTATLKAAIRCRSFNSGPGGEIYLGKPDLGVAGNRVENDFYRGATCDGSTPYGSWQASNHVKFWYVPADGKIYSRVTASDDYCLEYSAGDLGALNYVQLSVVNRASGTTVNFNNVKVNGHSVGNFVGSGWSNWMIKNINLTDGFTIEGDIVLEGTQPGGETNKVEIAVGYSVPPLEISKSHFPQTVTATWDFWYYIDVTNPGALPVTNVVITDTLPAGVAAYSVQPSMGGVFDGVNTVVWNIPSLGANSTVRVAIKARTYSTAAGKCITNWAWAKSDQTGPPVSASDSTCVVAPPPVQPTATPVPTPTPTPLPGTVVDLRGGLGDDNPDTYIYRYAPSTNYHVDPLLKVGYKQLFAALLRFDLSEIPPGATIDEAWLELYAGGWSGPGCDITIGAYAISNTVTIKETTWNEAHSGTAWIGAGCSDMLLDRRPVPEYRLTTSGPRKWYRFDLTGLVQEWVSGALPNNGVLLRQEESLPFTYFFTSHECSDPALRPRLVVRYQ